MIEIRGEGSLRNTLVEMERALEIAKLLIREMGHVSKWKLLYGEIPLLNHRVDAILEVETGNGPRCIAIEIVSKMEDIERNESKLKLLKSFGIVDDAYIVVMSPVDIEQDLSSKRDRIVKVV